MKHYTDRPYLVKWEIDIWANSPKEAAKEALKIQRDPNSKAVVFKVLENEILCDDAYPYTHLIDLQERDDLCGKN